MTASSRLVPRYNVSDYTQWPGDWELWEGLAIATSPSPFGKHQFLLAELTRLIGNAIVESQCQAIPLVELDWIISDDTVVRPDLVVVDRRQPDGNYGTETVVDQVAIDVCDDCQIKLSIASLFRE